MIAYLKKFVLQHVFKSAYKPGDYYSTIPDLNDVARNQDSIYSRKPPGGVDLNEHGQLSLLSSASAFVKDFDSLLAKPGMRYHTHNIFFNQADALALFVMMRTFRPARVIEVGSGFSSALMLDIRDTFQDIGTHLSFIEPYPDRLLSLLSPSDLKSTELRKSKVQDVPIDHFTQLKANDILFIDSSHVSKVGSDLNFLMFEVLPVLNKGVIVHFHDIFYPFEYPHQWIRDGIHWNENYLLRAFLMFNKGFEIILFNDHIHSRLTSDLVSHKFDRLAGGGSIYLRKNV